MERHTFGEFSRDELTNLAVQFEEEGNNFSLLLRWENDANEETSFDDDMVAVVIVRTSAEGEYRDTIVSYLDAKREDEHFSMPIGLVDSFDDGDTFYAYVGAGRNPRNPKEIINIPARKVVRFKAAESIRRAVNHG